MATQRRNAFASRSQYTASSKSRAVSPSMVTKGIARRSFVPLMSFAATFFGRRFAGLLHVARPFVRQVVLAQRDLDLHAGIGIVAEDLDHAPDGLGVLGGLLDDLGDHDLALLRAAQALGRDEDVLVDALVLGDEEGDAVLDEEPPDDLGVGALEHLDDRALERPLRSTPVTRARTTSPCSALCICLGPRKRSSLPSSGRRKPNPSGCR
jgi:hypothetical protein